MGMQEGQRHNFALPDPLPKPRLPGTAGHVTQVVGSRSAVGIRVQVVHAAPNLGVHSALPVTEPARILAKVLLGDLDALPSGGGAMEALVVRTVAA